MSTAQPSLITITLTIDTVKLYKVDPTTNPKQGHIDKYCSLTDNNSGNNEGTSSIEGFDSYLTEGNQVTWKGKHLNKGIKSKIKIISVACNTFLGPLTVKRSKFPVTLSEVGSGAKVQEYTITFSVSDTAGKNPQTYSIDPKITLNPPVIKKT